MKLAGAGGDHATAKRAQVMGMVETVSDHVPVLVDGFPFAGQVHGLTGVLYEHGSMAPGKGRDGSEMGRKA